MSVRSAGRDAVSGFTLLELLVVLAILGALMAAVPGALADLPAARLRAATAALAETLRQAHDDAIGSGRTTDVAINVRMRSYAATGQSVTDLPPTVDALEVVREGPGAANTDLCFFADGSATGGMITLHHAKRRTMIKVEWLTSRVLIDD